MYTEFFGLRESPFSIAPDPDYLYLSDRHKEALAHLMYGLNGGGGGFILLTGEVGTGKTTVCRSLLQELPDRTELAFILNPALTELELLATICDEFSIEYDHNAPSLKHLFDVIAAFLLSNHQQNMNSVLLIDEAQLLNPNVLEQLRLLTNLETDRKKLLQIILIGQPELQQLLKKDELRQLAQRITARYHLLPLNMIEVCNYIRHRLQVAGCQLPIFSKSSLKEIHRQSGGVPRLINLICDRALLAAFANSDHTITPLLIKSVANEVRGDGAVESLNARPFIYGAIALSAVLLGVLTLPYMSGPANVSEDELLAVVTGEISPAPELIENVDDVVAQALAQGQLNAQETEQEEEQETELDGDAEPTQIVATVNNTISMASETVASKKPAKAGVDQTPNDLKIQRRLEKVVVDSREPEAAMQNLYKVWGYEVPLQQATCERARAAGLHCLNSNGSIRTLKEMNHPAVVKMYDKRNDVYFATLIARDEKGFELLINTRRVKVSESWFNAHWSGAYTLFWQAPTGYEKAIGFGARGAAVQWLDDSLASVLGHSMRNAREFDYELQDRVMRFQDQHHLEADGIAGVQTILRLNLAVNNTMPKLKVEG
ncbi:MULTISPECIES: ExeA family protein [unclassified Motilimonas]|uniref:ExeA family protein n=1 Tax=Motilimonas TaxID=1914248 RepID=UPI00249F2517|nr:MULTISPECIES: ExeA family protein [unclassified Motilimonas]MCE0557420.1 AAA family ATPase [Motilimonas sp. E26]MDO6526874.1 AAA family ATPase [Motilimonas sp. 1_MG-2023]